MTNFQTAGQAAEEVELSPELIEEARELTRGAEILPGGYLGLAKKLHAAYASGRKLRVKLGVDPTSTDLHLGHSVVFRKLRRFQEFGHQVVLIIGGFTAQIGDPSGRNTTRPPLTSAQVMENAETYLNQMGLILDLEKTEMRNNADWLGPLTLVEILELASQVTINQLLAKEAFGERLDKQLPVSFHELFYPLLQGYDSVAIVADVELGGTDQRFNILQGRELQPHYGQEQQLACLLPLLEGTDGIKKMSKTYDNYIGLKEEPDDMFGKAMRIPDSLILKYFELATTLSGEEIDILKKKLSDGANPAEIKQTLGEQLVRQYHGDECAKEAKEKWSKVHSERQIPEDIASFMLSEELPLFKLLVETGMAESSAMAKRLIKEGGVRLDSVKITDPNWIFDSASTDSTDKVLQVGRRKFVRILREVH